MAGIVAVQRVIRRWRVSRAIESARRKGHGLYFTEWHQPIATLEDLSHEITQWCRETVAECRRPMGIDHFDLTLTVEGEGSRRTHRMPFLRPGQLYDDSAIPGALAALYGAWTAGKHDGTVRVFAALLSWGDVAHVTMN